MVADENPPSRSWIGNLTQISEGRENLVDDSQLVGWNIELTCSKLWTLFKNLRYSNLREFRYTLMVKTATIKVLLAPWELVYLRWPLWNWETLLCSLFSDIELFILNHEGTLSLTVLILLHSYFWAASPQHHLLSLLSLLLMSCTKGPGCLCSFS